MAATSQRGGTGTGGGGVGGGGVGGGISVEGYVVASLVETALEPPYTSSSRSSTCKFKFGWE